MSKDKPIDKNTADRIIAQIPNLTEREKDLIYQSGMVPKKHLQEVLDGINDLTDEQKLWLETYSYSLSIRSDLSRKMNLTDEESLLLRRQFLEENFSEHKEVKGTDTQQPSDSDLEG
jgi:hypothetical protein